jgi:serine/threonine protein kinase
VAKFSERCPGDDSLLALMSSRTSLEEAEPLLAHLDACADCRALAASMVRLAPAPTEEPPSSAPSLEPASIAPGATVGRYVVLQRIGAGGMGVVYAAYDPELDRKVALKLVRPGLRARASHLAREAHALARVSHPHVVAVHDVGYCGDQVYLVMEFVAGHTLRGWLSARARSKTEILAILAAAGEGLAAAHRAGVVHCDVKPENIMVDPERGARITDFGLARSAKAEGASSGTIAGTLGYMSPEQLRGEAVDASSDQFSFAVTVVEALTGEQPFPGATRTERLGAIARGAPPLKRTVGGPVPPGLAGALARALQADPARRWPGMDDLVRAMRPRRTSRALAVAGGLLAAAAIATAAGVGFERRASAERMVCRGATDKLGDVWGPRQSETVARAFSSLTLPYAGDASKTVRGMLDAYAADWARTYTLSCESTRLRKEQSETVMDAQMGCLDDRRRELGALADELSRPTEKTAERAVQAAAALTSVKSCLDPRSARAHRAYATPALEARADLVAGRIAHAKVQLDVGNDKAIAADLDSALADARELDDRRLVAKALLLRGRIEMTKGDPAAARRSFVDADLAAEADRDDDLVALARLRLVGVASTEQSRVADAEQYLGQADAAIVRLGSPASLKAQLLSARADVAYWSGDYDRAIALGQELLQGDRAAPERGSPLDLANHESMLGTALVKKNRLEEGREHLLAALAVQESAVGPMHPSVARALRGVAYVEWFLGADRDALEHTRRALSILEAAGVKKGPDWWSLHGDVARISCELEDWQAGIAVASEAVAAAEKRADDYDFIDAAYITLGTCLTGAGRLDEARDVFERGLAALPKLASPRATDEIDLQRGLAAVDLKTGHPEAARARLERVLAWYKTSTDANTGPDSVADTSFQLARALAASHVDLPRALSLARQAREKTASLSRRSPKRLAAIDAFLGAQGGSPEPHDQ